jgi:hypothetical protein
MAAVSAMIVLISMLRKLSGKIFPAPEDTLLTPDRGAHRNKP